MKGSLPIRSYVIFKTNSKKNFNGVLFFKYEKCAQTLNIFNILLEQKYQVGKTTRTTFRWNVHRQHGKNKMCSPNEQTLFINFYLRRRICHTTYTYLQSDLWEKNVAKVF